MRRALLLGWTACWIAAALPASAGPKIPASAINGLERLLGAEKVRYLLRQIDLTEEQATQAEGLIESIFTGESSDINATIEELRALYQQVDRALERRDRNQVEQLKKQLEQMGSANTGEAEFFRNLRPQLTEEQKQKLKRARDRVARNPRGTLRPIDLMRAASELDLSAQQRLDLLDAHKAYRRRLGPHLRLTPELRLELINLLADKLRAVLSPVQLAELEFRIRVLRADLIDQGLRVKPQAATNPPPDEKTTESVDE